jgi:hypothetical protein
MAVDGGVGTFTGIGGVGLPIHGLTALMAVDGGTSTRTCDCAGHGQAPTTKLPPTKFSTRPKKLKN